MGHDHTHHHHHDLQHASSKSIVIAFWLNTGFALLEIAGGFYTNSVAVLSDAVHDLGDSLSLGVAYYFHKKSKQKRSEAFHYGYRRFSLLGAFINSMILLVSSAFIIQESVTRLFSPEQSNVKGMLLLAIIGIIVNGVAMLRLQKGNSLNEKAIALHFLEDVLGWAVILIGSVVMLFYEVPVLDPILSIGISLFVLWNVLKNIRATFRILLQASPESINQDEVKREILSIEGVHDVHDLHFWTMDGQSHVVTLHAVVRSETDLKSMERIKQEIKHALQHFHFDHVTIELELENENCKPAVTH